MSRSSASLVVSGAVVLVFASALLLHIALGSALGDSEPAAPAAEAEGFVWFDETAVYELVSDDSRPQPLSTVMVDIQKEKCDGCVVWLELSLALLPNQFSYAQLMQTVIGACTHPVMSNYTRSPHRVIEEPYHVGTRMSQMRSSTATRNMTHVCTELIETSGEIILDTVWEQWTTHQIATQQLPDRICRMFSTC